MNTYAIYGLLGAGLIAALLMYRYETKKSRSSASESEVVEEAYFATTPSGEVGLYELIETAEGYTFRCSDPYDEETLFEGSAQDRLEAIGTAAWNALARELD